MATLEQAVQSSKSLKSASTEELEKYLENYLIQTSPETNPIVYKIISELLHRDDGSDKSKDKIKKAFDTLGIDSIADIIEKGGKKPVGYVSPDGKWRKTGESTWEPIKGQGQKKSSEPAIKEDVLKGIGELKEQIRKDLKKVAKSLSLPASSNYDLHNQVSWYKKGGHAGDKQVYTVIAKAKELGWMPTIDKQSTHPANDIVTNLDTLFSPDGNYRLEAHQRYGQTTYDNSYSIKLTSVNGTDVVLGKENPKPSEPVPTQPEQPTASVYSKELYDELNNITTGQFTNNMKDVHQAKEYMEKYLRPLLKDQHALSITLNEINNKDEYQLDDNLTKIKYLNEIKDKLFDPVYKEYMKDKIKPVIRESPGTMMNPNPPGYDELSDLNKLRYAEHKKYAEKYGSEFNAEKAIAQLKHQRKWSGPSPIASLGTINLKTGSSKYFNIYEFWGEDSTYEIYDTGNGNYKIVVTAGATPLHDPGDYATFKADQTGRILFGGNMVDWAKGSDLKKLADKYGSKIVGYAYK